MRVLNDVALDWGKVVVSGGISQSSSVPTRALVKFDTAEISIKNGPSINIGGLFSLIRTVRGATEDGWLETTFINENMRIGRGNKGTMFVLTREVDAVAT
jgi:hypothetical protein